MEGLTIDRNPGAAAHLRLAIGDASILDRCLSGELVVLEGFVQALGLDSLILPAIRGAVLRVAGKDAAAALDKLGYASAHRILTAGQLRKVVQLAEWNLYRMAPDLSHKTFALGLGVDSPTWVMRRPLLRFQIPFDAARTGAGLDQAFSGKYARGRFNSLRPHRDSWFSEPTDCINVWIGLTKVVQGNGLSFYQSTDGKVLRFQANRGIDRRQAVGSPVNIELEYGDALVFHAEKLHASELNRTDQTRSVLSLRLSTANPTLSASEPWRYMRIHPDNRFSCARLHPAYSIVSSRLSAARSKLLRRRWSSADTLVFESRDDLTDVLPASPSPDLTLKELASGQPVPAGRNVCVAQTRNGEVFSFRRYCPHQGADLSLGRVVDDRVVCPWHNLPFDLRTGRSPCTNLAGLNPERCEIHGDRVQVAAGGGADEVDEND
jgi:nitrite reductase/ring-hydroxylating ferredoxin subunit